MDWFQFIAAIVGSLAWPILAVVVVLTLRRQIRSVLSRLILVKHGGTEFSFSGISKRILYSEPTTEERTKFKALQVVAETNYFKLYGNGLLVQKYKFKIQAFSKDSKIIYPSTFPNEPINIQVIGDFDVRVVIMNQGNCSLAFEPSNVDREIELVISGV